MRVGGACGESSAPCPGSNQVVNSIKFCFLWKTLEGRRGLRKVGKEEESSKTLVSPVSSLSIKRETKGGAEQSQTKEENIKHSGKRRGKANRLAGLVLKGFVKLFYRMLQPPVVADGHRLTRGTVNKTY